jgi:hypothetical protein
VTVDQTHRVWLEILNAHVRAVHAHEVAAAALFERIGDPSSAEIESRRAATERSAYAHAVAEHPEWSVDGFFGLLRERGRRVATWGVRVAGPGER